MTGGQPLVARRKITYSEWGIAMSWTGLLQMHSQVLVNYCFFPGYHLIASNVCLIRHLTVWLFGRLIVSQDSAPIVLKAVLSPTKP